MYGGNPFSPRRRRKRGKSNRQPGFHHGGSSDRTLELLREASRRLSLYQRESGAASRFSSGLPGNVAVELPGGEQLLPNWRPAKDAQGRLYFYCLLTGETSWHKPRPMPALSLPGA